MADEKPADKPPELEKEANDRLRDARQWKDQLSYDMRECYFFAAPHRMNNVSSEQAPTTTKSTTYDVPDLNTDLAFILVADFITEILGTYMPEAQKWCERKAGEGVPEDVFKQVAEDVKAGDAKIFDAIKASNFYAELPKACDPDLAIGGAGLWINRPHPASPIRVLAVPLRELEINLGPDGEVDDRFMVRWPRNSYVKFLVGEHYSKIDEKTRKHIEEKPAERTQIAWGYWRKWDKLPNEVWQHVLLVKDKLIHQADLEGEGSCGLIVMRFNPSPDWPWATGPMQQGLPSLRQVDELELQRGMAVERSVNPAITYPDDSFAAVEQGLEPGMAYPVAPGRGQDVKRIYDQPSIEPEVYEYEFKERRLRKLFYVDHPEQSGDTPPTLGQWLDELARSQRRLGSKGTSFFREGPAKIFQRFKFLLEAAGSIKPIQDKTGRMISTQPYNPAQRAAEQQEIATATQCAQILAQMFPEEWRVWIDGKQTMQAFIAKMRTSGLLKMRSEGDVQAALTRITSLIGQSGLRQAAGAPVPEGAGAPAAA